MLSDEPAKMLFDEPAKRLFDELADIKSRSTWLPQTHHCGEF